MKECGSVFERIRLPMPRKDGELYIEKQDKITFEIAGDDLEKVRKFRDRHKNCAHGVAGEQFEYSFMPSGMGVAAAVKCSCGQVLELGDFVGVERPGEGDR